MFVTLLGMVTDFRPEQLLNAWDPMLVTLLGIIVFLHPIINSLLEVSIIALQLLRESYLLLPFSTTKEVRSEQPENAFCPMLVTLLGMVTEVRPPHPRNALLPMLVTPLPIITSLIEVFPRNQVPPISLQCNMTEVSPEQPLYLYVV